MTNIQMTIDEINELPDTDVVHCYDYEIRTDDLKSLVTELERLKAENERYRAAVELFEFV